MQIHINLIVVVVVFILIFKPMLMQEKQDITIFKNIRVSKNVGNTDKYKNKSGQLSRNYKSISAKDHLIIKVVR